MKRVQSSFLDQLGTDALPSLADSRVDYSVTPDSIDLAAYNGALHDQIVKYLAAQLRKHGSVVETEMPLYTVPGFSPATQAIADIMARPPLAVTPLLQTLDVKTGPNSKFTNRQRIVYPIAVLGNHIYTSDPRITRLGELPNMPLAPMDVYEIWYPKPRSRPKVTRVLLDPYL
jgi:hypothetical protein